MVDTARNPYPKSMWTESVGRDGVETWARDAMDAMTSYAGQKPFQFAAWSFAVGFLIAWRLKP